MSVFTDAQVRAAVDAYDDARRASHGGYEQPMSETNKKTITPMIRAALEAAEALDDSRLPSVDDWTD